MREEGRGRLARKLARLTARANEGLKAIVNGYKIEAECVVSDGIVASSRRVRS